MKKRTLLLSSAGILAGVGAAGAAAAALATVSLARRALRRYKTSVEVVMITGGSRGLGLALAKRYGLAGSKLVLVARDAEELERAQAILLGDGAIQHRGQVELITADVSDAHQVEAAVRTAIERFGRIDVLINNAGTIQVGPFQDQPSGAFVQAMASNFHPAVDAVRAVLPHMLDRGSGAIVNISSIGGKVAFPHLLPYVASKFALTGLSEGLHAELRSRGIRVTTVCPGLLRTGSHIQAEFTGDQAKEYRWFAWGATTPLLSASAQTAANRIFNAVAAGRAEITITPQAWLAARAVGVAPAATQAALSIVNRFLPAPSDKWELTRGRLVRRSATGRALDLELQNNQQ